MGACCSCEEPELRRVRQAVEAVEEKDAQKYVVPVRYCKVVRVYDGDTVFVVTKLRGEAVPHKFSVRLRGIDAPEMRGGSAEEKEAAIRARDALHGLIHGTFVELRNLGYDKYGRLLADIYTTGRSPIDIGQWMLKHGYAVAYYGGTKQPYAKIDCK